MGAQEYHTVVGQGVTGFLPAAGFIGDGPGQLVDQLAGMGVICLLAFLVTWLVFLALNLPYHPRKERKPRVRKAEKEEKNEEKQNEEIVIGDVLESKVGEERQSQEGKDGGAGVSAKISEVVARWGEFLRRE